MRNPQRGRPSVADHRPRHGRLQAARPEPAQNQLLAHLSAPALARLVPRLAPVYLDAGTVLFEPGDPRNALYFPTDAIVSLVYVTDSGASAEISVIGNEGALGLEGLMGGESSPSRALVHYPGHAFRLRATHAREECARGGEMQRLMLRYLHALMAQMGQTAVCNRHHPIEQQLCRWLLLSLDRLHTTCVHVTQEQVAHLLGVRREGVNLAAGKLQSLGVVACQRGVIEVLDRARLERLSCQCYAAVRNETARLFA